MRYKVVFLHQAKLDLHYIKNYILKNHSKKSWQDCLGKIKNAIYTLKTFPQSGNIPPELETLHLNQYRQIISGMNRIIYEIKNDTVFIHLICDSRKELKNILTNRLLRIV